jgi:hypothetical protein
MHIEARAAALRAKVTRAVLDQAETEDVRSDALARIESAEARLRAKPVGAEDTGATVG